VCRRGAGADAIHETGGGGGETCTGGGKTGRQARSQDGCAPFRFQQATGYGQRDP
jgi:hypothetical protein